MCTLSVVRAPWSDAWEASPIRWRLAFNRDEQRTRSTAMPPATRRDGSVRVAYPIDPDGGGTWIAVTSAGLAFALLNEDDESAAATRGGVISRGLVIPSLLQSASLDEVERRLRRYEADAHLPFRLLAIGEGGAVEGVHAGMGLKVTRLAPAARLIRTSTSVAPLETRLQRVALFDRLVAAPSPDAQDHFHAHQWPGSPEASVLMARSDARTVSVAVVDAFAHCLRLTYCALPDGGLHVTELPLAA